MAYIFLGTGILPVVSDSNESTLNETLISNGTHGITLKLPIRFVLCIQRLNDIKLRHYVLLIQRKKYTG